MVEIANKIHRNIKLLLSETMHFDRKNVNQIILQMRNPIKQINLFAITLFFCFISISSSAQNSTLTKYFDSTWNPTSKDAAFYFTEIFL